MKRITGNFLLLAVSLLLALGAGEIYLRVNPPIWLPSSMIYDVQQIHSEPAEDPRLGYLPRALSEGSFKGHEFSTRIRINSQNMRDREYPIEKTAGMPRVVAVGDSYLFGWGVEAEESVSELLESRYLQGVEILNLGVSGYCDNHKLARLETGGLKFAPDIVLFFLHGLPAACDFRLQFHKGMLYEAAARPENPLWRVFSGLNHRIYLWAFIDNGLEKLRSRIAPAVKQVLNFPAAEPAGPIFDPAEHQLQADAILARLKELSARYKFHLIFVFVPEEEEILNEMVRAEADMRPVEEFSKANGFGFVNLTNAFVNATQKTGRSLYFRYDAHWNREGHRIAAAEIARYFAASETLEPRYFRGER